MPSNLQKKIWAYWEEFWGQFVPEAPRGEPYIVVHNGDAVEGVPHKSVTQISPNPMDQEAFALKILKPIVELCEGRYYQIRGTEAHVAKSGSDEERLASKLGAVPNEEGQASRWDLWKSIGEGSADFVVNFLHHVGTTSSQAYESTAVHKELTESYLEAGRWHRRPPDAIVRSHRHRHIETAITTANGKAFAVVTPGWQGKTPFAYKIAGARISTPQFGGVVLRVAHGRLFSDPKVWTVAPSKTE